MYLYFLSCHRRFIEELSFPLRHFVNLQQYFFFFSFSRDSVIAFPLLSGFEVFCLTYVAQGLWEFLLLPHHLFNFLQHLSLVVPTREWALQHPSWCKGRDPCSVQFWCQQSPRSLCVDSQQSYITSLDISSNRTEPPREITLIFALLG